MPRLGSYDRLLLWQGMPNRACFIVPKRRPGDVYLDCPDQNADSLARSQMHIDASLMKVR